MSTPPTLLQGTPDPALVHVIASGLSETAARSHAAALDRDDEAHGRPIRHVPPPEDTCP